MASKAREYNLAYKRKNAEAIKEQRKGYRAKNVERIRRQVWANKLKARYGITPDQYAELMALHLWSCAICDSRERLTIDHDHKTGKVRGVLCARCNQGLGLFLENVGSLKHAIIYLTNNL